VGVPPIDESVCVLTSIRSSRAIGDDRDFVLEQLSAQRMRLIDDATGICTCDTFSSYS
jgi:hypothetical protein